MDELEIKNAYEQIGPGVQAKERMLSNILTRHKRTSQGWVPMAKKRRAWKAVPALLALVLVLCAAGFGWTAAADPFLLAPEAVLELVEDPYYQASMEWYDYVTETGVVEQERNETWYIQYEARNNDMRDYLKELSGKYDLALMGSRQTVVGTDNYAAFSEAVGVSLPVRDLEALLENHVEFDYADSVYWSFSTIIMLNEQHIWYGFNSVSKDWFSHGFWKMGHIENYRFWSYTTSDGEELIMALSESEAYLIHNGESTLSYVCVKDPGGRPISLTRRELEKVAEIFDFSKLS